MNKWIPISLAVFLGVYLLTTAQAFQEALPESHTTITLADQPGKQSQFTLQ